MAKKPAGPVYPSQLEGVHQIVQTEGDGGKVVATVKCGLKVKYAKGMAREAGATPWGSDVTCLDCKGAA